MASSGPPSSFATTSLDLTMIKSGARHGRVYFSRHPDPLGYGKTLSRFSDPRRRLPAKRFGVLYLGSTLKVCVVEAVLRDQGDGRTGELLLDERDLAVRSYAEVEVTAPLSLIDLRADGPLHMGVPSDVARGKHQSLARRWSVAFHDHPARADGIVYASRLNGETNLAIYDRAVGRLKVVSSGPLLRQSGLAHVLRDLKVGLQ